MSKQTLLLVDHDTRSMRVLEVSLRKAGFTVTSAVSVSDALDKLAVHAPDLIISETTFPSEHDGFELRRRVRGSPEWAEIPFIFLTAEQTIENKIKGLELGVDDYLTKPIYIKEIVTRINILLQKRQRVRFEERRDGRTRFAGRVQDMPVVDVIQTIEISRKSGVIQFVGDRGRQAAIYFRDGRVIDAEAGTLQGEDAVYRLLTWNEGEFEVVFRTVRRREVITTSSQGLLMEGMRRLDEWSRLLEQLPPLTHRFEVDPIELAARLGDIPDDNNPILRLVDGKRTLLEVIDGSDVGDLECLQVISRLFFEEILIDIDPGKPARRDTGKPMPFVEAEPSGPTDAAAPDESMRHSASSLVIDEQHAPVATPVAAPPAEPDAPADETALRGNYRPSSLRLIDEAVAAAQAIEPSLFEDDPPKAAPAGDSVPTAINDETPPRPRPRPRTKPPTQPPQPIVRPGREDSQMRMIGSLGRDRAETSGEVSIVRPDAGGEKLETQRELVTILPRRSTREVPVVDPAAALKVAKDAPAVAPVEEAKPAAPPAAETAPVAKPPVEPPARAPRPESPRMAEPVMRKTGPGLGALLLIVVAAALAGLAVYFLLRAPARPKLVPTIQQPAVAVDAALETPVAIDDAPLADAAVPLADASAPDAAVAVRPPPAPAPAEEPRSQGKQLYEQAVHALQEGDAEQALKLSEAALKLHKTARAHLTRATALQRLDRIDEAVQATYAAEKLAPTYPGVYDQRGRILWSARRFEAAREAFTRFLELEPPSTKRAAEVQRLLDRPQ